MNIVFFMDPMQSIIPQKDTSYVLMQAAARMGHSVYHLGSGDTCFVQDHWECRVQKIDPFSSDAAPVYRSEGWQSLRDDEIDYLLIRLDPPFDENYLMHTWIFEQFPDSCQVINAPNGVRTVNEKLWATQFRDLIPATWITRDAAQYMDILQKEGTVIVKPVQLFGGAGIFKVSAGDSNARVIFESATQGGSPVIVQRFLPDAKQGDKRIILVDGEPIGAILRVAAAGEHRNNFMAGGHAEATEITARDQEIIQALAPHLHELGLRFVGIDIIGGKLIEVNVTSPTCLQEMSHFAGERLEDKVMETLLS